MTGRVVHFELPYDDADRAQRFYAGTFGWQLAPMPGMDYTLVTTGPVAEDGRPTEPGFINGGMLARGDASAPAPVVVIDVSDLEETLRAVESAGGSVVTGATPVGDMGVTAYVRDTEGNVIGLWQTLGG